MITATKPAPPAAVTGTSRWLLPTILVATFMSALDMFIVNVAIPSLQRSLHATPGQITWVIAGFGITLAVGLTPAGRLGDRYGRRKMFALGLAVFVLASASCGLAPTAGVLIAARLVQGAGGALMGTQVLAVLRAQFSGAAQAKAFAMYGLTLGIGGVLGQLIGGLLIRADLFGLDWRTCFLINVPVGVAALIMVPRVVPESRATQRPGMDNTGTLLLTAALVALVVPLIQGRSAGWPLWAWLSFAAAAVLFAVFGVYEHRSAVPIVPPVLFRDRGFTFGVSTQFLLGLVQGSYFLVLALYLQYGRGLSALASGVVVTMLGAGYFATSTQGHRIEARLGRQAIGFGALVMVAGVALTWAAVGHIGAAGGFGGTMWMVPGMVIQGAGMGMVITSISSRVLRAVEPRHIGPAAGVLATTLQVGGAVGVALIGLIFFAVLGRSGATGFPHAFQVSLVALGGAQLLLAALAQLLPRNA
jgi:EmrB/QacA subfamily drug resistance transporter